MEELPFVVVVFVLGLQLLLHQLVALPHRGVLDALNLPATVTQKTELLFLRSLCVPLNTVPHEPDGATAPSRHSH